MQHNAHQIVHQTIQFAMLRTYVLYCAASVICSSSSRFCDTLCLQYHAKKRGDHFVVNSSSYVSH
eukprot:16225-Heterococcus_DN1.PRE.3